MNEPHVIASEAGTVTVENGEGHVFRFSQGPHGDELFVLLDSEPQWKAGARPAGAEVLIDAARQVALDFYRSEAARTSPPDDR